MVKTEGSRGAWLATLRTPRWLVSGAVAGLLLTPGALLLYFSKSPRPAVEGSLVVPAESLHFGTVWSSKEFLWKLPVKNVTSEELEVTDFVPSCVCSSVEPMPLKLAPGEEAFIRLTINFELDSRNDFTKPERRFSLMIVPRREKAALVPRPWELTGQVRKPITFSTELPTFDERLIKGAALTSREFAFTCHEEVSFVTAQCEPDHAMLAVTPVDGDERSHHVRITPRENLPAAQHDSQIVLRLRDTRGNEIPAVTVPISFKLVDDVEVVPARLSVGLAMVGTQFQETIRLRSLMGRQFSVLESAPSEDDVTCERVDLGDGSQEPSFKITFRVTDTGVAARKIRFLISQPGAPEPYEVSLPISYHGRSATVDAVQSG